MNIKEVFPDASVGASVKIIEEALEAFLHDKRLALSKQNLVRTKQLLSVRFFDQEIIDEHDVYSYLCGLYEYRADYSVNILAHDEAEDILIHIIASADHAESTCDTQGGLFKNSCLFRQSVAVAACLMIFAMAGLYAFSVDPQKVETGQTYARTYALVDPSIANKTIKEEEAYQLVRLSKEVTATERKRNNFTTRPTILNTLINLEGVAQYGTVSSYTEFNYAQYAEAKKFLEAWLERIRA